MNDAATTLAMATGALLRGHPEGDQLTRLEIVTPSRRVQCWRIVPNAELQRHVDEWCESNGIKREVDAEQWANSEVA